jgi:hypothetical protein
VAALGDEPETLVFDLNQWLRFDAPGPYRIYVQSSRIVGEPEWATGRIAIRFSRDDDDARASMVAQYVVDSMAELQAKLAQFPRGTRFAWQPIWRLPSDAAPIAAIEAFVTARGMSLEP